MKRSITCLHRIAAARYLNDGRTAEEIREALRVDRGRRDDELEVGASRQQSLEDPEQEIDIETALVRLVDDQRVVSAQQAVALQLLEQDPVRHHLDARLPAGPVREPHLVSHHRAYRGTQLSRETRSNGSRRYASRLRMTDQSLGA